MLQGSKPVLQFKLVGERLPFSFFFFATMTFTGHKFTMQGIQRLENKYSSDAEGSANHFPAQPAVNCDYTEQFLLLLSPFTSLSSEESGCISHGLRRWLQIRSAGFSSESTFTAVSCRLSSTFLGWVICKNHPSSLTYSYQSTWACCHDSSRLEVVGKQHREGERNFPSTFGANITPGARHGFLLWIRAG